MEEKKTVAETVVERYYTCKYRTDICNKKGQDMCVLVHSNKVSMYTRLCIITVAQSHPLVADQLEIEKVDFHVDGKTNRLENHVTGKGKKGGQFLAEGAGLCVVKCKDGRSFKLHSPVKAQLVEVNENLVSQPELITTKWQTDGYIAIVCPRIREYKETVAKLQTEEQYQQVLAARAAGNKSPTTDGNAPSTGTTSSGDVTACTSTKSNTHVDSTSTSNTVLSSTSANDILDAGDTMNVDEPPDTNLPSGDGAGGTKTCDPSRVTTADNTSDARNTSDVGNAPPLTDKMSSDDHANETASAEIRASSSGSGAAKAVGEHVEAMELS